jgi:hypothetical protein
MFSLISLITSLYKNVLANLKYDDNEENGEGKQLYE